MAKATASLYHVCKRTAILMVNNSTRQEDAQRGAHSVLPTCPGQSPNEATSPCVVLDARAAAETWGHNVTNAAATQQSHPRS